VVFYNHDDRLRWQHIVRARCPAATGDTWLRLADRSSAFAVEELLDSDFLFAVAACV
jgi:hypothetical protein